MSFLSLAVWCNLMNKDVLVQLTWKNRPRTNITGQWFADPHWHLLISTFDNNDLVTKWYYIRIIKHIALRFGAVTYLVNIMAWSCWGSSVVTLIQFLTALRTSAESTTVPEDVVVLKFSTNWDLEGRCNEKIVSLHLCFSINQDTNMPPKTRDLIPFLSWHNTVVGKITHVL